MGWLDIFNQFTYVKKGNNPWQLLNIKLLTNLSEVNII